MNTPVCYVQGSYIPLADAGIPLNDLGLQRGYGVFDYLRVSDGVPLFLDDHIRRFFHSAATMRMPVTESGDELKSIVHEIIRRNGLTSSGIRILLTGGSSDDGYTISVPRIAIFGQPLAALPDTLALSGLKLMSHAFQRQIPTVKTIDYLMAIWLQPWLKAGGGDDILYHQGGSVRECPRANIFIVDRQGILVTPAEDVLKGISRKQVILLAQRLGIPVEERALSLEEVYQASEAFITASTRRITPIALVDGKAFSGIGPRTRQLWDAFLAHDKEYITNHNYCL